VDNYEQRRFQASDADLDRLRLILRDEDLQRLQQGVQGWYLRENPTTGRDEGGFRYPNRATPVTVQILLNWADATADAAEEEIARFDAAGIPFVPIGDVGQQQLRDDLRDFRQDLLRWDSETARAIREVPNIEGGDLRWRREVLGPVFFGLLPDGTDTYPQFLRARILGRAAGVGAQALDEAADQFWADVKKRSSVATGVASIGVFAALLGLAAFGAVYFGRR